MRSGSRHAFDAHMPYTLTYLARCRVHEAAARRRWVALVEGVEAAGGKVFIFSARHVSGRQLLDFSGVAAVLRFGMPELEESDPAELMAAMRI
jgi:eRF1 domain 3